MCLLVSASHCYASQVPVLSLCPPNWIPYFYAFHLSAFSDEYLEYFFLSVNCTISYLKHFRDFHYVYDKIWIPIFDLHFPWTPFSFTQLLFVWLPLFYSPCPFQVLRHTKVFLPWELYTFPEPWSSSLLLRPCVQP